LASGTQINIGKHLAVLPNDGAIRHAALPENGKTQTNQYGSNANEQPVTKSDEPQPRH
jgi:hypothetical protein